MLVYTYKTELATFLNMDFSLAWMKLENFTSSLLNPLSTNFIYIQFSEKVIQLPEQIRLIITLLV